MSKYIEMRRGPQETKTVLLDSADIKPIYYPLLLVLRSHLLTFPPYFFISFNYLHSLYSSTDFSALHPLDSFYSGKQQRVDRIYYLIQTVLPVDKKKKSLIDSSAWEKRFCRNEDGFFQNLFLRHNYLLRFLCFVRPQNLLTRKLFPSASFFQSNFFTLLTTLTLVTYSILLSFTILTFSLFESLDFLYFLDFLLPFPLFLTSNTSYDFFILFSSYSPLTYSCSFFSHYSFYSFGILSPLSPHSLLRLLVLR